MNKEPLELAREAHKDLREVRQSLQFANDSPNGGINDTIWMMEGPETLFDGFDRSLAALESALSALQAESEKPAEGLTDERIIDLYDEFGPPSPDRVPVNFARAIEAEVRRVAPVAAPSAAPTDAALTPKHVCGDDRGGIRRRVTLLLHRGNDGSADGRPPRKKGLTMDYEDIADSICLSVAELNTGPLRSEDWPDAMLVTQDELREIVIAALSARGSDVPQAVAVATAWMRDGQMVNAFPQPPRTPEQWAKYDADGYWSGKGFSEAPLYATPPASATPVAADRLLNAAKGVLHHRSQMGAPMTVPAWQELESAVRDATQAPAVVGAASPAGGAVEGVKR